MAHTIILNFQTKGVVKEEEGVKNCPFQRYAINGSCLIPVLPDHHVRLTRIPFPVNNLW